MKIIINTYTPLLFCFLLAACGSSDNTKTVIPSDGSGTDDETVALKAAVSDAALESQIKTALLSSYGTLNNYYSTYLTETLSSDDTAVSVAPAAASAAATSTTNTQESAVDEADRLKTDGSYLYVSSLEQPNIRIFKAETGAAPLVKNHTLATLNQAPLSGFYLRDAANQLVAVSGDGAQPYAIGDMWFAPYYWQNRKTELFDLDISNPEAPTQQAKLSIDGQLISSRRIGSYLYLATRHTPMPEGVVKYPESQTDVTLNKSIINNANLSDLLPTYQINDGEKQSLFDSGDCFATDYANANNLQSSIISVVAINLDAAMPEPEAKCFVGDAETLYMSKKALYLATTHETLRLWLRHGSELEIDGYSDYLHPVGENYLLGIGKDAIADTSTGNINGDGRGAWYQGVKLSLIDISNPSAPFEKEKIIIGGRGTETAVSQSHHALTTLQDGNTLRMALPISLHYTSRGSNSYNINDPRYRYEWTRDELYRLNIDTSNGNISVLPSITSDSNETGNDYYTRYESDRSVMIGDEVYYLHKNEIRTTADITPEPVVTAATD